MDKIETPLIFTAAELMKLKFPEPKWLIDDLLPEGVTVLSGAPKIGKSWLSLQIALSISTSGRLFGSTSSTGKRVLLLALEDNSRRLQERIIKSTLPASDKFVLTTEWTTGITGLKTYLEQSLPFDLCIIDTFGVFLPGQDTKGRNAYDADVARMRQIHMLCKATETSLLLIHHDKQGDDGDWANKMNGSSGIIGTADTLMRLSVQQRGEKKAKLQVTGRDVEDIELSLKLNEKVMQWQIDKNQDETPLTGLQKSVLDLVPEETTSTKSSIIASKLNKEQSQISDILKKLKVKGYIYNPQYGEYTKTGS